MILAMLAFDTFSASSCSISGRRLSRRELKLPGGRPRR